jgi:site-specific DNA-methyltransferase (adenine-specific)/modification methylase
MSAPRKETLADGVDIWLGDCRDVLPMVECIFSVVADPPYGIKEAAGKNGSRGNLAIAKDYGTDSWDN